MKLNWGSGIAAVYILFMVGVLIMVFIFMNQDVLLETDNYYSKGIKYQEQIDKAARTNELPEQLVIKLSNNNIIFSFPKIFKQTKIGGSIYFYRPSNNQKDFAIKIQTDTSAVQMISSDKLEKGLWKVKANWFANNQSYYNEKLLMVN